MSSFFLLFLHNLSRTQKKVGIELSCLISEPLIENQDEKSFVFPSYPHSLSCFAVVFLITGILLDEDSAVWLLPTYLIDKLFFLLL